jgi:orotate phosphoribosyltransferase
MDWSFIVGAASFAFTAVGSVAAVLALRRPKTPRPPPGTTVVEERQARRALGLRGRWPIRSRDVRSILAKFVFVSNDGRVPFGTLDQMTSSVFLDLFTACTFPRYRNAVARLLASCIRRSVQNERPTHVAVAKEGNVLLADAVARRLRADLIIVRTALPAIRFGNPIEGSLPGGACVVLVDDIAADGEMLVRTVTEVRRHGGRISRCFCVVERLDGNSAHRLMERDVTLVPPIQLDETTLRTLARLPARITLGNGPVADAGSSADTA